MAEPIVIANTWLNVTLRAFAGVSAIVGTRVHGGDAIPQGVTYPAILFEYISGVPAIAHNGIWTMTTLTYIVRGIVTDEQAAGVAGTLAAAIVSAIHRKSGTGAGGNVWSCQKVDDYQFHQTLPERTYRHLGGEFELTVS